MIGKVLLIQRIIRQPYLRNLLLADIVALSFLFAVVSSFISLF
jgi:hypothetical protein